MNPSKRLKQLYVQVLIGLPVGITVGHLWLDFGAALKPLGDGFVKLMKMMIAPIVFCTIVSGITSLSDNREIGKTLLKSMWLFYALTIVALLTGLAAVFLMQPGAGIHIDLQHLDAVGAAKYASKAPPRGFTEFVLYIIPSSFFFVVVLRALARLHGFSLWNLLRYIREELLVVLGTPSSDSVAARASWASCCRPATRSTSMAPRST